MNARKAFSVRLATRDDIPALEPLIEAAIRVLLRQHLAEEEVTASFSVMGLDTQLIDDGTYYVVEADGCIAGCGGWNRRATLFGGNHTAGRSEALLDPARDAARVRAMYTHPDFARKGVGRMILDHCEVAAAKKDSGGSNSPPRCRACRCIVCAVTSTSNPSASRRRRV